MSLTTFSILYLWCSDEWEQFNQKLLHLIIFFMSNPGFLRVILMCSGIFGHPISARATRDIGGSARRSTGTDIRSTTSTTITTANSTGTTSGTGTPETGTFWNNMNLWTIRIVLLYYDYNTTLILIVVNDQMWWPTTKTKQRIKILLL
jgi:hypothetical protein